MFAQFKKMSSLENPHQWDSELLQAFFEGTQRLSGKTIIQHDIAISGIKYSITNGEAALKAYGHTFSRRLREKDIWIQSSIELQEHSQDIIDNNNLPEDFYADGNPLLKPVPENLSGFSGRVYLGTTGQGLDKKAASLEVSLSFSNELENSQLQQIEKIFECCRQENQLPILQLRLEIPDSLDVDNTIKNVNIDDFPSLRISRYWLESTSVFNSKILSKSLVYKEDML